MQHDYVLKKLIFDLLTPSLGTVGVIEWESAGEIFAAKLLHFVVPFKSICNMTMFWKSWILTYWPHPRGGGLGEGVCLAKKMLPCINAILFNLICNTTMFKKKLNFNQLTTSPGESGKIFATMLLQSWFVLFDMQHDCVLKKLILTPTTGSGGRVS